jgi:uncharacterized protein YndB with AHSA1/START domain
MPYTMGFATECEIAATPERVWELLTNAPGYPAWNPTVQAIDGTVSHGEHIKVRAGGAKRALRFKVARSYRDGRFRLRVTPRVAPPQAPPARDHGGVEGETMIWSGGLPLRLFSRVRTFTVTPAANGVHFRIEEIFSGPLLQLPSVRRSSDRAKWLGDSFADWAERLRQAAES